MHKNAQKVERKSQTKNNIYYLPLHMATMVKISHLNDAFLEVFLTASKPSGSITTAKRNEKEKKERQKKI